LAGNGAPPTVAASSADRPMVERVNMERESKRDALYAAIFDDD
jgi:hypothetical protein